MRNLLIASLLMTTFIGGCFADATALPDLRGSYRVIAVFADTAARAQRSADALRSTPGVADRDIAWFVIGPEQVVSNIDDQPSRKQLETLHDVDAFEVVLLGKDGSVKATQLGGMNLQELFDAVDGMPMRKQEMQQP